jgi:hypothetical protein
VKEAGKGFEFIGKDDLPTHAELKMARKDMPSHLITLGQISSGHKNIFWVLK